MKIILRKALLFLLLACTSAVFAKETPGDYDMQYLGETSASARFVPFGNLGGRRWAGNTVNWWYNPQGQLFATEQVLAAVQAAARSWERISGVRFRYQGTTSQPLSGVADSGTVIGWLDADIFNARFGNYGAFTTIWWNSGGVIDGEMSLNRALRIGLSDLQGIVAHEMGHLIGLDHSDVADSVMYARPYHDYRYMQFLREDDVNAAQALYPAAIDCAMTHAGVLTAQYDLHLPVLRGSDGRVWWADLVFDQGTQFRVANYGVYGAPPFRGSACAADATLASNLKVNAPLLEFDNRWLWAVLEPSGERSGDDRFRVVEYGAAGS